MSLVPARSLNNFVRKTYNSLILQKLARFHSYISRSLNLALAFAPISIKVRQTALSALHGKCADCPIGLAKLNYSCLYQWMPKKRLHKTYPNWIGHYTDPCSVLSAVVFSFLLADIGVTYPYPYPPLFGLGVPYPPLFRTQVKNLLSSEAICGDQITL